MRLTIPVAAGVLVAVFAACAKPVPRDQAKDSRPILLPNTLPSADAVASDLETGRPPRLIETVLRRAHSSASRPGRSAMAATASTPVPPVAETPESQPILELTPAPAAMTALEPAAPPATATPVAPAADEGYAAGTWHGHHVDMGGGGLGSYGRGPGSILRGGMGGTDDKWDLRPRGARAGFAINRSAPPIGGGYGPGIR